MGTRGGVQIVERTGKHEEQVFLYSHSDGCLLPFILKWLLDEAQPGPRAAAVSLAVILTQECDQRLLGTFEVRWTPLPSDHLMVLVDWNARQISFVDPENKVPPSGPWTFEQYARMDDVEVDKAYHREDGPRTAEGWATLRRAIGEPPSEAELSLAPDCLGALLGPRRSEPNMRRLDMHARKVN